MKTENAPGVWLRALIHSLVLCFALSIASANAASPSETVQSAVDQILQILKNDALAQEDRWAQIGRIIRQRFDIEYMSRSILATNWKRATPEEQRDFIDFFSQYLENTYRQKIEGYDNEQVRFVGEKVEGDRATVDTSIVTQSAEIPVVYKLRDNDGQWYAYDVVIEGVSLISNYRNTFAAIVKSEGMDGLLLNLQDSIQKYKAQSTP